MGDVGERELLAIIFTDAVGSSRQTAQDEDKSLSMLMADLDFIRNEAGVRGGSVLKNTGDGLLISFKSAVDAVECAIAIQKSFQSRPKGIGFQHKIGVHIGDVIKKDRDIYGAGVNMASRLTDQCRPGGICLSSTLFELTKQKSEIGKLKLNNFLLQNTEPPALAYQGEDFDSKPAAGIQMGKVTRPSVLAGKPIILWLILGAVAAALSGFAIWQIDHNHPPNADNSLLYGFEYKSGPREGLKSAKYGSQIIWSLENNTDRSLEIRWFDFEGRPKVSDHLQKELTKLGPGQKDFQGKTTFRGHAFGLFDAESQTMLGSFRFKNGEKLDLVAEQEGDRVVLEPKYLRKAKKGDSLAQARLAYAFWSGKGVPHNNEEAATWAKLSADQNNALGQCVYAGCLDLGSGVPRNNALALEFWRKAASGGSDWAYEHLGGLYLSGEGGVPKDYAMAVQFLRQSVEKGSPWGMVKLGRCYENGWGVPLDLHQAEELYKKASSYPDCEEGRQALLEFQAKSEKKP